jgi:U3 small nucleolar RNA-associated protein 5
MALSQIEMRSSTTPAPLVSRSNKRAAPKKSVGRYVEGESGDEAREEVEVEMEGDDGSVEDVEFGASSDDDDDEGEESDEDDDDDSGEDDDGPTMNGFIDDEAEEYSEDESE